MKTFDDLRQYIAQLERTLSPAHCAMLANTLYAQAEWCVFTMLNGSEVTVAGSELPPKQVDNDLYAQMLLSDTNDKNVRTEKFLSEQYDKNITAEISSSEQYDKNITAGISSSEQYDKNIAAQISLSEQSGDHPAKKWRVKSKISGRDNAKTHFIFEGTQQQHIHNYTPPELTDAYKGKTYTKLGFLRKGIAGQQIVYNAMNHTNMTRKEMATITGLTPYQVTDYLYKLKSAGLVKVTEHYHGPNFNGKLKAYGWTRVDMLHLLPKED